MNGQHKKMKSQRQWEALKTRRGREQLYDCEVFLNLPPRMYNK
jgi:hypothetical protein